MDKQDIIDLIHAGYLNFAAEAFAVQSQQIVWEVMKATESPGPGWQPFAEGSYGIILWRRIKEVK